MDELTNRGLKVAIKNQIEKTSKARVEALVSLAESIHLQDVEANLNSYYIYSQLFTQLTDLLDEL